jgi:uncharacterized integral membrane protein
LKNWKSAGLAVLAILAIVVVLQNTDDATTRILFVTVTMPRAVMLFITLALGFAVGLVMGARLARKPPAGKPAAG